MENSEEQSHKEGQSISIKEFLFLCLSKWYLFVIALAITCGYAVYYLAKTSKVYSAEAAILVKDGAGNTPDVSVALSEIDMLNTNVNINNEMVALKSPVIMKEVSHRLGLDANYTIKTGLSRTILFGNTLPVSLQFPGLGDDGRAKVKMKYSADGTLEIGPFAVAGEDIEVTGKSAEVTINLNDVASDSTLETSLGEIVVVPNEKFKGLGEGESLDITVDRVGYAAGAARILGSLKTAVRDNYSSVI